MIFRKIRLFLKGLVVNVLFFILDKKCLKEVSVTDSRETILRIVDDNVSVARYGDGEFKCMLNIKQHSFQENNAKLSSRLKEVLLSDNENVLVCIPRAIINDSENTFESKIYWRAFLVKHLTALGHYLRHDYKYGNASFTRPYIPAQKKQSASQIFNDMKKIWDGKDLLIVEGEGTRLGVGNDLLSNAGDVRRIICPSKDAFIMYDEILNTVKQYSDGRVVLAALGPTATVLAYDLANYGIQCIDIGHVDLEYEWFLMGAKERTVIHGKSVNELGRNDEFDEPDKISGEIYEKEIICKIGKSNKC